MERYLHQIREGSPGPGAYNIDDSAATHSSPTYRFGTAQRSTTSAREEHVEGDMMYNIPAAVPIAPRYELPAHILSKYSSDN
jgi:hypothetical protein